MSTEPRASAHLHIDDQGGTGRPVVLIHGWPLSGATWEHQLPALRAAGYRAITYDRRGFGRSQKPASGYDYDTLAADLNAILTDLDLKDVTLVGFSMGGGEIARYVSRYDTDRLRSVVFASAVPPYMLKTADNPDGPLTEAKAKSTEDAVRKDRNAFFDQFTKDFFTANATLKVSEVERQKAIAVCRQSDQTALLGCMKAFGTTDFREDLTSVTMPALVLHGDSDSIVPFEGSGARTQKAIPNSRLVVLPGAPHGCNVSHAGAFNAALIDFLQ